MGLVGIMPLISLIQSEVVLSKRLGPWVRVSGLVRSTAKLVTRHVIIDLMARGKYVRRRWVGRTCPVNAKPARPIMLRHVTWVVLPKP